MLLTLDIMAQEMMEEKKRKQEDEDDLFKEIRKLFYEQILKIPFLGRCIQGTFEEVQTRTRELSTAIPISNVN